MSLIKREDLIDHLNDCLAESDGGTPITDAVIVAIRSAVEQMPEVDAVPVVRCRECVYCRENRYAKLLVCGAQTNPNIVSENGFCSCGERRVEA